MGGNASAKREVNSWMQMRIHFQISKMDHLSNKSQKEVYMDLPQVLIRSLDRKYAN